MEWYRPEMDPYKTAPPQIISISELKIDPDRRLVSRGGVEISLTRTEFDILLFLARNADRVVRSKTILRKIWGPQYGDTQTLRVHMGHLRKKIEPDPAAPSYVLTEAGVGYRLAVPKINRAKRAASA